MPKLDIEFELTGLKLKIKGESDDVSGKVANLQNQVQNLMGTIASLTQGAAAGNGATPPPKLIEGNSHTEAPSLKARKAPARRSGGSGQRKAPEVVDFKHDAEKYGVPSQEWSTARKAMWMLYQLEETTGKKEHSIAAITNTFNKHFRSYGDVRRQNVLRDLEKERAGSKYVNSDNSQEPVLWFLLESGKKHVAQLIAGEAAA